MVPHAKSLVATVGLVTVLLSEWPLTDESPAYLAIVAAFGLLVLANQLGLAPWSDNEPVV